MQYKFISTQEARRRLAEILEEVRVRKTFYFITHYGKPVAKLGEAPESQLKAIKKARKALGFSPPF